MSLSCLFAHVSVEQYQMVASSPAWVSPMPHWHALDLSATMLLLFSLLLMLELRRSFALSPERSAEVSPRVFSSSFDISVSCSADVLVAFLLFDRATKATPRRVSSDSRGAMRLHGDSSRLSLLASTSSGWRRQYAAINPGAVNPATDAPMLKIACMDP